MKRFLFLFLIVNPYLYADSEPALISIGGGVFDIIKAKHRTAEFRVEYRPRLEALLFKERETIRGSIRPLVGLMATIKGSTYLYFGFGLDFIVKKRLVFTPNFAAGWYRQGGGKDLGFPLEFRSGIELGWRFKNCMRAGAHFYHISNASMGRKNPGKESLVFFLSIPVSACPSL